MSWSPCPDPVPGDRASTEAIEILIVPRAVDLGEMEVRRALPSVKRQMVGPFIFFDQMGPAEFLTDQGIDVRPHPHINLATVTYLFEGQILHRDSLGTEKTIEPGAVNWMRAGRGIVHSERTSPERKRTRAAPVRNPDLDGAAGGAGGERPRLRPSRLGRTADGGCRRHHGAPHRGRGVRRAFAAEDALRDALCGRASRAGAQLPIDPSYEERALYTIAGEIEVAGDAFGPGQLLVLRPGDPIGCGRRPTPSSCSSAAPRWEGRVTSGGTSSPRGRSASSRPRRNGREGASTRCRVTWRSSSPCPKHRRSRGARPGRSSTLKTPAQDKAGTGFYEEMIISTALLRPELFDSSRQLRRSSAPRGRRASRARPLPGGSTCDASRTARRSSTSG